MIELKTLVELCIESYKDVDKINPFNGWYPLMQGSYAPVASFIKTNYEKIKDKKHSKLAFANSSNDSNGDQERLNSNDIESLSNEALQKRIHMIAFYNLVDNQVVIVFRGTNFTFDIDDVFNDIQLAMQLTPDRVENALAFIRKVEEMIGTWSFWKNHSLFKHCHWKRPTITLTGHSLGASIAEAVANQVSYSTITFESPGIPQRNQRLMHRNNIKSINSYPNIFNTANPHSGKVFHIPTGIRERRVDHVQKAFTDGLILAASQGAKLAINLLVGYFGIELGLPLNNVIDKINSCFGEYLSYSRPHLEHVAKTHSLAAIHEYFSSHGENELLEMQDWPTLEDILKKDPASEIARLDALWSRKTAQNVSKSHN